MVSIQHIQKPFTLAYFFSWPHIYLRNWVLEAIWEVLCFLSWELIMEDSRKSILLWWNQLQYHTHSQDAQGLRLDFCKTTGLPWPPSPYFAYHVCINLPLICHSHENTSWPLLQRSLIQDRMFSETECFHLSKHLVNIHICHCPHNSIYTSSFLSMH